MRRRVFRSYSIILAELVAVWVLGGIGIGLGLWLDGIDGSVLTWFASLAVCYLSARSLRIRLVLSDEGAWIHNLLRSRFVDWRDVTEIRAECRFMPIGLLGTFWFTVRFVTPVRAPHVMALELFGQRGCAKFVEEVRPIAAVHGIDLSKLHAPCSRFSGSWGY